MDATLSRLCAIPGNDDLSPGQARDVLGGGRHGIQAALNKGKIESKRYEMRGNGVKPRVLIPRAAIVRYLVQSTHGDRSVIFAAIKAQCPQYLPAVADLMPGASHLPDNVIPMDGTKVKRPKPTHKPETWHPNQLALFNDFPGQASA